MGRTEDFASLQYIAMGKIMNALFSLEGKSALLTGGGRGIGAAVATGLRDAGASVAVFEHIFPDELPEGIKFYKVDLSKKTELIKKFDQFIEDFEGIDVLLNNAGITIPSPSEEYSLEDWNRTIDINLSAPFLLCQLAGKAMIQHRIKGSIINFISIGAAQGFPNNPAYGATKGGLCQLTKALANDWGKYGIRVNNLAPGYTRTPMNQNSWSNPRTKKIRSNATLLGRWAEPEDMVGPAIFLASDASCYVTGTDLFVDGGWVVKGL